MKAIDTNILVRWITRDDPVQTPIADGIMARAVYVSPTVLLELVWVLGGRAYRFDRLTIASALRAIIQSRTVSVPQESDLCWAIDRFEAGGDIEDMMHIATARGSGSFLSFEKRLAAFAGPDTPLPIERVG